MHVCSFDLPGVKVLQLELLWALYCFQINYGMRKNISGVTKKKKKKFQRQWIWPFGHIRGAWELTVQTNVHGSRISSQYCVHTVL